MEISGRVLREVEFRDRLRGYDTEEVDDFLEKVAVAVDGLLAELEAARSAASRAERDPIDDESLRRTLVLAQRTADLAIKEARDEAAGMLEEARAQAESLVGAARDEAKRLREGAEVDASAKIAEFDARRGELEAEVESLTAFVESERRKFVAGLSQALDVVRASLERGERPGAASEEPPADEGRARHTRRGRPASPDDAGPATELVDSLPEEEEDGASQAKGEAREAKGEKGEAEGSLEVENELPTEDEVPEDALSQSEEAALAEVEAVVDPDEELWQRWAKGGDLEANAARGGRVLRSNEGRGERRGRSWSA